MLGSLHLCSLRCYWTSGLYFPWLRSLPWIIKNGEFRLWAMETDYKAARPTQLLHTKNETKFISQREVERNVPRNFWLGFHSEEYLPLNWAVSKYGHLVGNKSLNSPNWIEVVRTLLLTRACNERGVTTVHVLSVTVMWIFLSFQGEPGMAGIKVGCGSQLKHKSIDQLKCVVCVGIHQLCIARFIGIHDSGKVMTVCFSF